MQIIRIVIGYKTIWSITVPVGVWLVSVGDLQQKLHLNKHGKRESLSNTSHPFRSISLEDKKNIRRGSGVNLFWSKHRERERQVTWSSSPASLSLSLVWKMSQTHNSAASAHRNNTNINRGNEINIMHGGEHYTLAAEGQVPLAHNTQKTHFTSWK